MKRVLFLGDSIRMGYDRIVADLLKDEYEVIYSGDNGRFASYTLWQANDMFAEYGHFDLVHWNNGYWDMCVKPPMNEPFCPIDEYVNTLKRTIKLIRQNGAQVVFATTTPSPVRGSAADNTGTGVTIVFDNDLVIRYNEAAKKVMKEENVMVNDLYSLCLQDPGLYKCEDQVHLSDEGNHVVAAHVAELIRRILK